MFECILFYHKKVDTVSETLYNKKARTDTVSEKEGGDKNGTFRLKKRRNSRSLQRTI